MSLEDLKIYLSQRFDLVCFEDLASFRNTQRAIFDLFKEKYQDVFSDNQRFVFYSSHYLEQSFLNHIQRAATSTNIGNFFITIITPYDLSEMLNRARIHHGNAELTSISHIQINIDSSLPFGPINFLQTYDSICVYPFIHLDIDFDGKLVPCCKFKGNFGDLNNTSLREAFNSNQINYFRNRLSKGDRPEECSICWNAERHGQTSLREYGLLKYGKQLDQGWYDDHQIRHINYSPSILCNFKCRICSASGSSKFAAEDIKYAVTPEEKIIAKKFIDIATSVSYTTNTFKEIFDNLTYVEFLHILGGEPFLWPGLGNFLDKIIESGFAKNIELAFNTNGSVYPESIISKLLEFKSIELAISVDDINERFELQRGGKWDSVYQNICKFKKLQSTNFTVNIATTVNIQNLLYLDHVVDLFQMLDLKIVWSFLETPQFLSVDFVTSTVKKLVYEKYINHHAPELQELAKRMYNTPPVSNTLFLEYMDKFDTRRNENSKTVLKEIVEAMSNKVIK